MTSGEPKPLSAGDVADIMGWSRTTAWRWLKGLPEMFTIRRGAKGKWIGITRANLEALAKSARPPIDDRIERRLADIERQLADNDTRVSGVVSDVRDLKRRVNGPPVG